MRITLRLKQFIIQMFFSNSYMVYILQELKLYYTYLMTAQFLTIISSVVSGTRGVVGKKSKNVGRKGDGTLSGVKQDAQTLYQYGLKFEWSYRGSYEFGEKLLETINKETLLQKISDLFMQAENYHKTILYYSGHGCEKNGNWVLETKYGVEYISPRQIFQLWEKYGPEIAEPAGEIDRQLVIISDSCFSGHWCYQLKKFKTEKLMAVRASSSPTQYSYDWGSGLGGAFTFCEFKTKNMGDRQQLAKCQTPHQSGYDLYGNFNLEQPYKIYK